MFIMVIITLFNDLIVTRIVFLVVLLVDLL